MRKRGPRGGKRGSVREEAISLFYLFCYLEGLSPEVQREVQQEEKGKKEEKKKSGDLCARGQRGINFRTKLSPTIKLKSKPTSPKQDLKTNTFSGQHSHPEHTVQAQ